MKLAREDPEPATFLDTIPSLLFATSSVTALLGEEHERAFKDAGIDTFINKIRKQLCQIPISSENADGKSREKAADDLTLLVKELELILDMDGSLQSSFNEANLKRLLVEWLPFVHLLFYASLVLLLYKNSIDDDNQNIGKSSLSSIILQRFIPTMTKIYTLSNEYENDVLSFKSIAADSPANWLKVGWSLINGATVLKDSTKKVISFRTESVPFAIFLLARLVCIYLPWSTENSIQINVQMFEKSGFDIRRIPEFSQLLRLGLVSSDAAVRKQALFILKMVVKFCTIYMQPEGSFSPSLTPSKSAPLFIWNAQDRPAWGQIWKQFFILYESVHETQVHIVEPLIPILRSLLVPDVDSNQGLFDIVLPIEWWEVIVRRAVVTDSDNVRKCVIKAILMIDLTNCPRLAEAKEFLLETFFKAIDNTSLYTNPDAPTIVSRFGMNVAKFYSTYLDSNNCTILEYLKNIRTTIRSATPALFLIQALLMLESNDRFKLGMEEITLMKSLCKDTSLFHNIKARRLARWQVLQAFLCLADIDMLSFTDIAGALTEFLREQPEQLAIGSVEFIKICTWFKTNLGDDYLDSNISLSVQQYFTSGMNDNDVPTVKELQRKSEEIATMLAFTLSQPGGFAQGVRPLYQHMALIGSKDSTALFIISAVTLFTTLNSTVKHISKGQADLMGNFDVSSRLYEWIATLERLLLDQSDTLPDLASILILLDTLRLFFSKAEERPSDLIAYLDIVLYKMVDLLEEFERQSAAQKAESHSLQLQKLIAFTLMDMGFKSLERIGSFHLGFLNEKVLHRVFTTELEKPPAMNDTQSDDWTSLITHFDIARWSLIGTMAYFSRQSAEMHRLVIISNVFQQCVDALEEASYQSVLAIFNCMRILVSFPPFSIDNNENDNASNNSSLDIHGGEEVEYEVGKSELEDSFSVAKRVLEEAASTPSWFFLYLEAFIDYFFQSSLLCRFDVYADGVDSLAAKALEFLIKIGGSRKNVIARLGKNLCSIWKTTEGRDSLRALQPYFIQFLLYGPVREEVEDRLAHSLTISAKKDQQDNQTSVGSDYLTRVQMNSILLQLDPDNSPDKDFALAIVDDLLDFALFK